MSGTCTKEELGSCDFSSGFLEITTLDLFSFLFVGINGKLFSNLANLGADFYELKPDLVPFNWSIFHYSEILRFFCP